jgi:hypothetical protein
MAQQSSGLVSYMTEKVSQPRWVAYALCFMVFFAVWTIPTATLSAKVLVTAALMSLAMTGWFHWYERHGRELIERHPVGHIVVLSIVLIVLLAICWYGIQRHRHNLELNTRPTVSRLWANPI